MIKKKIIKDETKRKLNHYKVANKPTIPWDHTYFQLFSFLFPSVFFSLGIRKSKKIRNFFSNMILNPIKIHKCWNDKKTTTFLPKSYISLLTFFIINTFLYKKKWCFNNLNAHFTMATLQNFSNFAYSHHIIEHHFSIQFFLLFHTTQISYNIQG